MATVRVTRASEYMNKFRNYSIYIDGIKVGAVGNGGTEDFAVTEGPHTIYAKIDLGYSSELKFEITGSSVATFNLSLPKNSKWIMIGVLFIVLLRPALQKATGYPHLDIVYLILALVYLVYIFTLGRRKRLLLVQDMTTNDYVPYSKK